MTQTLGMRVREVRKAWKWSQDDLAKALWCDQASISFWERDQTLPYGCSMVAMAALFNCTVDALKTGHDWVVPIQPTDLPVFHGTKPDVKAARPKE